MNDFRILPIGAHEIKIVVKDRQQNQSVALLPILKLPAQRRRWLSEKT